MARRVIILHGQACNYIPLLMYAKWIP